MYQVPMFTCRIVCMALLYGPVYQGGSDVSSIKAQDP